jgi:hypothetical protein
VKDFLEIEKPKILQFTDWFYRQKQQIFILILKVKLMLAK